MTEIQSCFRINELDTEMMKPPDMKRIPSAEFIRSIADEMTSTPAEEVGFWARTMNERFHLSEALYDAIRLFSADAARRKLSGEFSLEECLWNLVTRSMSCAFQLGFMVSERMNDPQSPVSSDPGDTPPEPFILVNKLGRD